MKTSLFARVAAALLPMAMDMGMGPSFMRQQYANDGLQRKYGPGWSRSQVQRMARKKRNQVKNRRAHRG